MQGLQKRLEEYAKIIIQKGLGLQEGQPLVIRMSAAHGAFAELLVEEAYRQGSSDVRVEFNHQPLTRLHYKYQTTESLSEIPPRRLAELQENIDRKPATLFIDSSDPDGLQGIDQEKMQKVSQAQFPIIKPYRDQIENKYAWCIAAASSPEWARKVFPDLDEAEAVDKLWDEILKACHVDGEKDALKAWDEHNRNFDERSKWLNDNAFDYLHLKSDEGTDFKVWLSDKIKWGGGADTLGTGQVFNPNMPTEEIFTTPIAGKAEGVVHSSKPLSSRGQIIDNFWIEFEDGSAVRWDAEKGKDVLDSLLTMDEGARRLGEVALVPDASPISQSGILFYNTLFDENASCHLAIGRGFSNLLDGFEDMSKEEQEAAGINESMIHVDFMIGSPSMQIDGVTRSGEVVPIFRDGNWA